MPTNLLFLPRIRMTIIFGGNEVFHYLFADYLLGRDVLSGYSEIFCGRQVLSGIACRADRDAGRTVLRDLF